MASSVVTLADFTPAHVLHQHDGVRWAAAAGARFELQRPLPAGVHRFRLRMTSSHRARMELRPDYGEGELDRDAIRLPEIFSALELDTYVHFRKPVRALAFVPPEHGTFTVEQFELRALSGAQVFLRSIGTKFRELRARKRFGGAFRKGLGLLLRGDFAALKSKVVQSMGSAADPNPQDYRRWRALHALTDAKRAVLRERASALKNPPRISVLTPVYNVPEPYLRACIDSVRNQLYPHWQLCLADDCSTAPHVRRVLDEYARADERITVVYREKNGHISAASNSALEKATGEYVALLDNDDTLAEHALLCMAERIVADPALDMLYSDEDMLDPDGQHINPFFKPDWSPEYFLACMYTCHLGVYRTALVRELGGFRSAFDTAQDYDLVLRVMERTQRIGHVPEILYHWRQLPTSTASGASAKPKAHLTAQRALGEHLQRSGKGGTVEDGPAAGFHRVRYALRGTPKVSIIIPSACREVKIRGQSSFWALNCVRSIREKSTWRELEILVLDREQMPAELERELNALGVKRVRYSEPFNWSRVNNLGARAASGEHLLFLNDDMDVRTPDWIEALLEFSQDPQIGAVGGKLFFEDGTLQHAGITIVDGKPGHPFYALDGAHLGYFMNCAVHRNALAVTGACLMTRRTVFEQLGGFNEDFPLNYNDVDYGLKVLSAGLRTVFTPYAQLTHFESVTRSDKPGSSLEAFQALWQQRVPRDPYYNPNLTADYRIRLDDAP